MAVTRTFWQPVSHGLSAATLQFGRLDETKTTRPMSAGPAWDNYFGNDVLAQAALVSNQFIGDHVNGWLGNWGLIQTGQADPLPQIIVDYKTIKTDNRQAWAAAKRPGSLAIVVSDYQQGRYIINQGHGSGNLTIGAYQTITASHEHCNGWLNSPPGKARNALEHRGLQWASGNPVVRTRFRRVTGLFDQTPIDLGFPMADLREFLDKLPTRLQVDSEMVTDVLAEANTGLVDALTAMAETPELYRSILNGCKTVLRMYLDAKRGNLRWVNKAKKVRLEIERENARFLRASQRRDEFDKIRDTEAHLSRIKTLQRTLDEFLTAAANVWLTYRLAIYPVAKTIESTIEALDRLDKKFIRFRELNRSAIVPPEYSGWTCEGSIEVTHRCFIKRGAMKQEMKNLLFTQNPILTMWELVPLSFIIDRYMNIGNFIAASVYRRNSKVTEGATYSWKVDSGVIYTHESGATVAVDINLYRREVINPSSHVCIPFPDSRSKAQHLDHLALAWNLVIKRFTTGR